MLEGHEGYEILTANTGTDGIEISRRHKPNLILLDVMMPDMDGSEVASQIKIIRIQKIFR